MVTRTENFFFSDEIDHCERLVSLFEYISSLGVGNGSLVTQEWDKLSLHDDELFSCLEKGIYYRGMINLTREQSLLDSMQAIARKFGEMRERLEVLHVPVDISRGTVLECNQACRKIVTRLEKLSLTFAVCLHAAVRVHDEYVIISIKPRHSSYDSGSCCVTVVHVDEGVTLYQDGNTRCQEMIEFLLVEQHNAQQHRIRHHNDELKEGYSNPGRQSVENARRLANDLRNPHVNAPVPVSMQMVVAVDLTAFNATDDGVIEAENTLAACKASVLELRKAEKAATIWSMRAMVADLEEVIRIERYKQEEKQEEQVRASPWDFGDHTDKDAPTSNKRLEEGEGVISAPWDYGDLRLSPSSPLTHSPGGTLMRERMGHASSSHSIDNGSLSPPRSPYRYGESDREEAEKEQNTPQGRRRRYRNFLAEEDSPSSNIGITTMSAPRDFVRDRESTQTAGRSGTSVSVMQTSLDQGGLGGSRQDQEQQGVPVAGGALVGEDWGDPWVNQRSLSLTSRLEVADDVDAEGKEERDYAPAPAPLGACATFLSPERELPTPGKDQPSPFLDRYADLHTGNLADDGTEAHVFGGSPEREDGDEHDDDDDENDGALLEPVAEFEEGRPAAQALLALSPARTSIAPSHSLGRGFHSNANVGAVVDRAPPQVLSTASPSARARGSIDTDGNVDDVVRVSVDGHQEEVRISNSSLYVPAEAALVDDDEEEEVLRSRESDTRARIAVQEAVTERMSAEYARQAEVLYSPDRRRTAPLAAAAAIAFQDKDDGDDAQGETDPDSIWHFNRQVSSKGQPQTQRSVIEEEETYGSVDNSLAEVSMSPTRGGSRDSSLILTPDGRKNPHGRIFITSPVDEDEQENKDEEENDDNLSPQRAMLGDPAPAGASPPRRASNPGLDPGPRTSSKAASYPIEVPQKISTLSDRGSTGGSLLEESMHKVLHQFIAGRDSTDSTISGVSVDVDSLSKQAYAAIRDAVLEDVLRESKESPTPISLEGSSRASLRGSLGAGTVDEADEEVKVESALLPSSVQSHDSHRSPLRSSQSSTSTGTITSHRSSPQSLKQKQKPKGKTSKSNIVDGAGVKSNKTISRLQRARAVYAAQQRAEAVAKSPSKAKNKDKTEAPVKREQGQSIFLRDTVPAIAATAIAAGTLRALAGAVGAAISKGARGPPPPPMGSPCTTLPTMSPRRLSSSSPSSPAVLPASPEISRRREDRAGVTMSMGSSADWGEGSSAIGDSPPRPPPVPEHKYESRPLAAIRLSDYDDYDSGKGTSWRRQESDEDDNGSAANPSIRDPFVSHGDDIGPGPEPEPQITTMSDSRIMSRSSSSAGVLSASSDKKPDAALEQAVVEGHMTLRESVDPTSTGETGGYTDLYFDPTAPERVNYNVTSRGVTNTAGHFPVRRSLNDSVSSWGSAIGTGQLASSRQSPMRGSTEGSSGGLRKSQEVRRAISIIEEAMRAEQAREERVTLEVHLNTDVDANATGGIASDATLEESLLDDISLDYGQDSSNLSASIEPSTTVSAPGGGPGSLDLSTSLSMASTTGAGTRSRPGTAASHTSSWGVKANQEQAEIEEFEQLESAIAGSNSGTLSSPPFSHLQQEQRQHHQNDADQEEDDEKEEEVAAREALRNARGLVENREKQRKESLAARRQHRAKALLQRLDGNSAAADTAGAPKTSANTDSLDVGRDKPPNLKIKGEEPHVQQESDPVLSFAQTISANVPSSRAGQVHLTPAHLKGGMHPARGGEAFDIDFTSPPPSSSQLPPRRQEQAQPRINRQPPPERAQPLATDIDINPRDRLEERKRRVVAQAEAREAARKQKVRSERGAYDGSTEYPVDSAGQPLLPVSAASASAASADTYDVGGLQASSKGGNAGDGASTFQQVELPAPPVRLGASNSVRARGEKALRSRLSNVSRVKNAIANVCLAGPSNQEMREKCFAALDHWHSGEGAEKRRRRLTSMALAMGTPDAPGGASGGARTVPISSAVSQFVVLFYHSKTLSFRGLYAVDPITASLYRIHGRGPLELPTDKISGFLKYETGSRSFVPLTHVKSLTSICDAVSVEPSSLKKGHH